MAESVSGKDIFANLPPFHQALRSMESGDEHTWSLLYTTLTPSMLSRASRIDSQIAEEAVGAVWEEFSNKFKNPKFQPSQTFQTYVHLQNSLCLLAHNRAVDLVRSATRRTTRERTVFVAQDIPRPSLEADTLDEIGGKSLRQRLPDIIGNEQAAVLLLIADGFTVAEIASILKISLGTAKSRARLGKAKLRTQDAQAALSKITEISVENNAGET